MTISSRGAATARTERPPLVSVLIVNYRSYPELTACLDSLCRFRQPDLEVVVVDHASDPLAAATVVERFPWIHLICDTRNPGFAAGVNRAAERAHGDYLLLLNPDSIVDEDVPRQLAERMDNDPEVGAGGAVVRDADGTLQASARRFPDMTTAWGGRTSFLSRVWPANPWTRRNLILPADDGRPIEVDWIAGSCLMVRRQAFSEVGGMDERFFLYWEDADLCLRLRRGGWSIVYYPVRGVTHLTGRSGDAHPVRALVAFHRSAFRYFIKHAGPAGKLAAPLVYVALQARLLVRIVLLKMRP